MNPRLSDEEIKSLLNDRIEEIKIAFYEEIYEMRQMIQTNQEK